MDTVIINFMFQPDWAMGVLAIWSNAILVIPRMRVLLDEINTSIYRLDKAYYPYVGEPHPIT